MFILTAMLTTTASVRAKKAAPKASTKDIVLSWQHLHGAKRSVTRFKLLGETDVQMKMLAMKAAS